MRVVVQVNAEVARTVVRAYPSALLPYSGALSLTGGDALSLQGEGRLEREPDTNWYLRESARNAGRFAVDLERPSDDPLRDLGIDVPPPFTLSTPSTRLKWSERIELAWDRANGDHVTSVAVESSCSKRWARTLESDTGTYTVNGGEVARLDPSTPCTVRVSVVRAAPMQSSRVLYALAFQTRTVEITLEP